MIRCGPDSIALVAIGALALLAAAPAARADCLDLADPAVVTDDGVLRGLPPGTVRWRTGRASAGGPHLDTRVDLAWTEAGGREARQAIFAGIQDGLPVISRRGAILELRVTNCPPGRDCRDTRLRYAWDPAARRFVGADAATQAALAASCITGG